MVKIFVDSGSSIKLSEKEKYGVEIIPLKIFLDGKEYTDGVDLPFDEFYHALIDKKLFPKTSLPEARDAKAMVDAALDEGNDVIILTISSGISGTYNAFRLLFADEPRVRVVDTKTAVGGIRILAMEAAKYQNEPLEVVAEKVEALIPRIKIVAIPDTLDYLQRGGRLSKAAWVFGSILQLKPFITISTVTGHVGVINKERGRARAMKVLAEYLDKLGCDTNYPIVPSYTYNSKNLDELIAITDEKYKPAMIEYDNLDPAIACHWGPGAYGYIFVGDPA